MTVADVVKSTTQTALGSVVLYDAFVPDDPADRYVVMYPDPGTVFSEDVAHTSNLARFRFRLTYVTRGSQAGRGGVEWLSAKCRTALVDQKLTVTGWVLGPVELESTQPVAKDEDEPGAMTLFCSDGFTILAARA